jgi:hypothetical protein
MPIEAHPLGGERLADCFLANPRKKARTAAEHYHGPLELYLAQGFAVHRELPDCWIVRKPLRSGPAAP